MTESNGPERGERAIEQEEGRTLFGQNADLYHQARPPYPDEVDALLRVRCVPGPSGERPRAIDIGAGSGQMAERLWRIGFAPVLAVEPDPGFGPKLAALHERSQGEILHEATPFESLELADESLDLILAATSFHWLDRDAACARIRRTLRPGGWLVLLWHVFGDPTRHDPFHEATKDLLRDLWASPSHAAPGASATRPYALNHSARRADFRAAGAEEAFELVELRWTLRSSPAEVRDLYATLSPLARLTELERERLLDAVAEVAESEFGALVERPIVTPVYLGRRSG